MTVTSLINENLTMINSNKLADILDLLVDRGFRTDKMIFPEDYNLIRNLIKNGATTKHFGFGYEAATQLMGSQENFSTNYLAVIMNQCCKLS